MRAPAVLALGLALLAPALLAAAAPAAELAAEPVPPLAGREMRLTVGETATVVDAGASAAFAVDSTVVETSVVGGDLVVVGRRTGQTLVTLVKPDGVDTLAVRVEPPAARALAADRTTAAHSLGYWEGRYDSSNRRLSTTLSVATAAHGRTARLRLFGVSESGGAGGRAVRSLPSASLELTAPGRSVVLLDELVEASPLTLDGVVLRGLHLRQGGLALHAGIAAATPWDDLLLPADGDRALGISYRLQRGGTRLVPAALWLPDAGTRSPGVLSLGIERGGADDALQLRGELGWSGVPGGSLDANFRGARQHGWLQAAYRPSDFAALGLARPPGTFVDGAWSGSLGRRVTADLSLSTSALDLTGHRQEAQSGRVDLRLQASERWALTGGVGAGGYRDRERQGSDFRRRALSLGTSYAAANLGVAAAYRYQETSLASHGGHGGRVTVRAGRGAWRGHLFADAQEDAPTVALILGSRPGLERAFAELGLSAGTPEEVVRLLRDNSILLAERGVDVGALELDPLRLQAGGDVAWRGGGARHPELGLRVVVDEARGVATRRRGYLATASGGARLFGDTDLQLRYTRWSQRRDGGAPDSRGSMEVGLRTRLDDGLLAAFGSRSIRGTVSRDDEARGDLAGKLLPLGGVEVVLDGVRRTRTDSDGGFLFDPVGSGAHRVEVVLPAIPGAYFTTASTARLQPGGEARFAITFSSARLSGHVRSDAGTPLAGVAVRLEGATRGTATTDSAGAFVFAAAAGEARLSLVADSLPPGFDLGGLRTATVRLDAGAPAVVDFSVAAQRSVSGVVRGARSAVLTVTAEGSGRSVNPAADGRFVLRGLPAGAVTLVARSGHAEARQVVELPDEPTALTGVELSPR